jgi:hypothetical protein
MADILCKGDDSGELQFEVEDWVMNPKNYPHAFVDGRTYSNELGDFTLKCRHIGNLTVSSGFIVACDPLTLTDPFPFTTKVPIGSHKVILSLEIDEKGMESVTLAKLKFTEQTPVSWEMALQKDQNLAHLKEDEFFGYAVDTGLGCFIDAAYVQALASHLKNPDNFDRIIYGPNLDRLGWTWSELNLDLASGANVIMFRTRFGDGCYPSFFGYDENENVAELITDYVAEEDLNT